MRQLLHQSQHLSSAIAWRHQRGRRQAKDGNFHAPAGACATEPALNSAHGRSSAKMILFHFTMKQRVK